jgi:hypothetical protein
MVNAQNPTGIPNAVTGAGDVHKGLEFENYERRIANIKKITKDELRIRN